MRILLTSLAGLLGLAFGSFLNVCLSRWPEGESVMQPRSHCRECGRTLTWWENIPLMSWVALRGRCRTCGVWIGWRYPVVELAVGTLWGMVAWQLISQLENPLTVSTFTLGSLQVDILPAIATAFFLFIMVGLAVLDAEHLWIADAITLPGIVLGLILPFIPESMTTSRIGLGGGFWIPFGQRLLATVIGAGIILLIRWVYWLVRRREGMGLGDAKLMAMLGAWLGLQGALLSFAIGVLLGAVVGIVILARAGRGENPEGSARAKLPFGTFLCIGGIVSSLWGQPIIAAYLRFAGFQ